MITRQFYKYKQLYDENVRQGEKTELLSPDIVQVGKNVDLIKTTLVETRKKLKNIMTSSGEDGKRTKNHKLCLAQTLMEVSEKYSKESLLFSILCKSGQIVAALAGEWANYENIMEDEIVRKIQCLIDNDLTLVDKLRKKLSKARLDLDACRSRYTSTVKQNVSKDKVMMLETEVNDLTSKFENAQDMLAIDLLNFVSKEKDYAMLYVQMMEAEMEYHKNSLNILTSSLQGLRDLARSSVFQPVFGISLDQQQQIFGKEISFVISECVEYIEEVGLELEGIFRMAGSAIRIKKLKAGFDSGVLNLKEDSIDAYSVAGCLKQYLRDLPEPILTYQLESEWFLVPSVNSTKKRDYVIALVRKLPAVNFANLRYLFKFLVKVSTRSDANKMVPSNLAIVIGPNLLWSKDEGKQMACTGVAAFITEFMITNFKCVFGNDLAESESSCDQRCNDHLSASTVPVVSRPQLPRRMTEHK